MLLSSLPELPAAGPLYVDEALGVDEDVLAPTDVLLFIAVLGVLAPADAFASAPAADECPGWLFRQSVNETPCRFAHGA